MKYILGDLIRDAKQFDVICHQCNCFCTFGAGIALGIKKTFPAAYEVDLSTKPGDRSKMGTINFTENTQPIICNMYGQYGYSKTGVSTDYDALRNCLKQVKAKFTGKKIGMPLIGAGLAGGDWNIISKIIDEELIAEDVTIVIFEQEDRPEFLRLLG